MPTSDPDELEVLAAYEKGELRSVSSKEEIDRYRSAARATGLKDKRVNIRLSSGDLMDIQVKAERRN